MTLPQTHLTRALAALLLAGGLGACGTMGLGTNNEEEVQYTDEPVAAIYNRGADYLDRARWAQALASFEEVERQHPYSSWARRSMLLEAYAHYQSNQYDDAI
jgi:outer membrane protein assembly factor BamD